MCLRQSGSQEETGLPLSLPSEVQEGSLMHWPSLRHSKTLTINCHQVLGKPVAPTTLQKIVCKSLLVLASRSCQSSELGLWA